MSSRYTSDGRRRSSMTHANHSHTCDCGRVCWGNGGWTSHARACPTYRQVNGVFINDGERQDWSNYLREEGVRDFSARFDILRRAAHHAAEAGRDRIEPADVQWAKAGAS